MEVRMLHAVPSKAPQIVDMSSSTPRGKSPPAAMRRRSSPCLCDSNFKDACTDVRGLHSKAEAWDVFTQRRSSDRMRLAINYLSRSTGVVSLGVSPKAASPPQTFLC